VSQLSAEFLYQQPEVLIAFVLLSLLALASEAGYRQGRRGRPANNEWTRTEILSIQAAIVGVLSLLLGFTFAMALSRFESRKQIVVQESNAIGTAVLRAQFLPPPQDSAAKALFRRYVGIRLESVLHTAQASPARSQFDAEARDIQGQLWDMARSAAAADPQSIPLSLFAHAMNEVIDIKATRDIAVANHVPESVLLLLMVLAVLAMGSLGYGNGLAGARSWRPTAAYSVIVVLVILLIIDLDRPQRGLARVSQASMSHLQEVLTLGPG